MVLNDLKIIGENIRRARKRLGMTQLEVAEIAHLSERAYADIERGASNARLDSILWICRALNITPNDILIDEGISDEQKDTDIMKRLDLCTQKERSTALALLRVYLDSIRT